MAPFFISPVIAPAQSVQAQKLSDLAVRSKAHWGYSAAFMQACKTELSYTPELIVTKPTFVASIEQQLVGFYQLQTVNARQAELDDFLLIIIHWVGYWDVAF